MTPEYYVGLDVGGTTMKACVVDAAGTPSGQVALLTEPGRGQEAGLETMCEAIRKAVHSAGLTMADISGIGVATPGLMDIAAGVILDPPNLKPWRDVPVRDHIKAVFGLPTAFQNDANAAAFGEFWVGAGKEFNSLVLFTLGTGVGGGIILDSTVLEGASSHGGELGHAKISFGKDARLCGCGQRGCLEAYASATSVVKRAEEALAAGETSVLRETLQDADYERKCALIFQAAEKGDALAARIVDETALYLALGATNVMNTVNPEAVVFAGGMTAAGKPFLDRIQHYVREVGLPVPAAKTVIRYAELGSDAGRLGAAACAKKLVRGSL